MRATGVIRRIDDLGRVVIPKEIRKMIGIREGDPLEIFVNEEEIILKAHNVSIGLIEIVRRLDNEFTDVKNDIKTEIAEKIYEHINALQDILNSMDVS